jgi:hypothetical protein
LKAEISNDDDGEAINLDENSRAEDDLEIVPEPQSPLTKRPFSLLDAVADIAKTDATQPSTSGLFKTCLFKFALTLTIL